MDEAPTHQEPDIPYREFEYTVLVVGFEQDPGPSIYPKLDALGGVVLEERKYLEGGVVERMPWWKYLPRRLLWRLGIKLGTRPREL
jgi:hypothetical protein